MYKEYHFILLKDELFYPHFKIFVLERLKCATWGKLHNKPPLSGKERLITNMQETTTLTQIKPSNTNPNHIGVIYSLGVFSHVTFTNFLRDIVQYAPSPLPLWLELVVKRLWKWLILALRISRKLVWSCDTRCQPTVLLLYGYTKTLRTFEHISVYFLSCLRCYKMQQRKLISLLRSQIFALTIW